MAEQNSPTAKWSKSGRYAEVKVKEALPEDLVLRGRSFNAFTKESLGLRGRTI